VLTNVELQSSELAASSQIQSNYVQTQMQIKQSWEISQPKTPASKPSLPEKKFVFNKCKLSALTLQVLNDSRLPISVKESGVVIDRLFEQMVSFGPRDLINPGSRGYLLGVEVIFDQFPDLKIREGKNGELKTNPKVLYYIITRTRKRK